MNSNLKAAIPHIIAVVLFVVSAQTYYAPELSGKVLDQFDNVQARGMQAEVIKYREGTGHAPLWTNSMFGGMPAYQIWADTGTKMFSYVRKLFMFGKKGTSPSGALILLMGMFYILMLTLGVDWRLGIIGAIGYAFAVNHIVLTEAGHSTKILAMAYLPAILAGILLVFRGNYLFGGFLTALFVALELLANHIQITYYFLILLSIFGIFELVKAVKEKTLADFGKAVGVLLLAAIIGGGVSGGKLLATYEYQEETIRGKSELTTDGPYSNSSADKKQGGLSKSYIFQWSYGVSETMSLLVPNYMGGGTNYSFISEPGSNTATAWRTVGGQIQQQQPQQANQIAQALSQKTTPYWGAKPSTSGPVYAGAVICFLFILGFILVKTPFKWWLIVASLVAFMFGWGSNFQAFNYFMVDNFPLFNKFRAVDMAMGLPQMFFVTLAMLGLKELMTNKGLDKAEKLKSLYLAGGIVGGLCVLIYLGGAMGMFSFTRESDFTSLAGTNLTLNSFPDLLAAIKADRAGLLKADALRSLLFVGLSFGALWLYLKGTLKWNILIPVLGILMLVDHWGVDRRYLDADNFEPKASIQEIQPTAVDLDIMKDPDLHYRVLDLTATNGGPYTSTRASNFHKSLGGYHAAKLGLFQDLCEFYLFNYSTPTSAKITGMLNTKYFIVNNPQTNQPAKYPNREALGNAWLVDTIKYVPDPDAEIAALETLNPRREALLQDKYKDYVSGIQPSSQAGTITLKSYHPEEMVYQVNTTSEQLAMFSEMYYPPEKGWHVYVDKGNGRERLEGDFVKANYALRAARIPAGNYSLIMAFESSKFKMGRTLTFVTTIIILLGLIFSIYQTIKKGEPVVETPEFIEIASPTTKAKPKKTQRKVKPTTKTDNKQQSKRRKKK